MIAFTSAEAQNRFGELIDRSQRKPIQITRRGRTVAYVVSEHDMKEVVDIHKRREDAAQWYSAYRRDIADQPANALSNENVNQLVHELR